MQKLIGGIISFLIYAFAASAEAHTLFSCAVKRLNRPVMDSFGDVELDLRSLVTVQVDNNGKPFLTLGGKVYRGANEYRLRSNERLIAYNVESSDIEIGYILKIDILNGGVGALLGYSSDVEEGTDLEKVARSIATIQCRRTAP